jgi:hypothetical protein
MDPAEIARMDPEGDFDKRVLLNPTVLDLLGDVAGHKVLDAGAGQGYFSRIRRRRLRHGPDLHSRLGARARRAGGRVAAGREAGPQPSAPVLNALVREGLSISAFAEPGLSEADATAPDAPSTAGLLRHVPSFLVIRAEKPA